MDKLVKREGAIISPLEKQVSQALSDLQNNSEVMSQLRELYIVGAKEVAVGGKTTIIIYVPVPMLKQFQKIQIRLVGELEKKFSGKTVVFLAKRRILPKPMRGTKQRPQKQKRPHSRTLTAVHDAWLDEMVFPAEVVGRRIRVKLDGKHVHKIHLDSYHETSMEHKMDTLAAVYRKLTGKDVVFMFPQPIF